MKKIENGSRVLPFLFVPEEWPKEAAIQMIETTEGRNKLRTKMNILKGDETSKQLMGYLKDLKEKSLRILSSQLQKS